MMLAAAECNVTLEVLVNTSTAYHTELYHSIYIYCLSHKIIPQLNDPVTVDKLYVQSIFILEQFVLSH